MKNDNSRGAIRTPLTRAAVEQLIARMKAAGFEEPMEFILRPEEATPEQLHLIESCGGVVRLDSTVDGTPGFHLGTRSDDPELEPDTERNPALS